MDKVIIFDTTLRDGEQAAGGSMNLSEKLEIARQLEKLGVDVIEAGFPISSQGDFESVKLIAQEVRGSIICGLARAHPSEARRAMSLCSVITLETTSVSPSRHLRGDCCLP